MTKLIFTYLGTVLLTFLSNKKKNKLKNIIFLKKQLYLTMKFVKSAIAPLNLE